MFVYEHKIFFIHKIHARIQRKNNEEIKIDEVCDKAKINNLLGLLKCCRFNLDCD